MRDDPLVVPAHEPLCLPQEVRGGPPGLVGGEVVDDPVVKLDEEQVQLRDDEVLVVARVAEQRAALLVARQVHRRQRVVAGGAAHEQVDPRTARAIPVVEEGLVGGAGPVERVEVQARRAEVDERVGVVVALQLRSGIERDVVVDELPEVRVARRDRLVVLAARPARHVIDERVERRVVQLPGLELGEHPAEAPALLGRPAALPARRCQAVPRGGGGHRGDRPARILRCVHAPAGGTTRSVMSMILTRLNQTIGGADGRIAIPTT